MEGPEIAVVDADQRGVEAQGALELLLVVAFHEHIEPERARISLQVVQQCVANRVDDEQDAIRTPCARFQHLIGIDDEVLAQDRKRARRARRGEVVARAAEILPVGEDRQAGRTVGLVGSGDPRRIEIRADEAAARACALDLADHGRLSGRDLRAQRALEPAHRARRARAPFDFASVHPRPGLLDLDALGGEDLP